MKTTVWTLSWTTCILGNDEPPPDLSARETAKNPEKNETPSEEPTSEAFQIGQPSASPLMTGENTAAFSPRYAGFTRRAVAMGIDCVIIATFVYLTWRAALDLAGDAGLMPYLYLACYTLAFPFAYFVYFHAVGGQTPGKMALGVRVVAQTGAGAGTARSVFRALGYLFSFAFFAAGFLWALFDRRGQAWHDKLAGTVVLEI